MRILILAVFALTIHAQSMTMDELAIRKTIAKYVDARDNKDAAALEKLFVEDADQMVSTGEWRQGREQVVKGSILSSQKETGKRTIDIDAVRMIGKDVALADGKYQIGGSNRKMRTTFLLRRTPDAWRIAAIRNMLPAPAAQ